MQKRVNIAGIATLLGYSVRHTRDHVTKRPDFPKPIIALSTHNRWWSEVEVLRWAERVSQAA